MIHAANTKISYLVLPQSVATNGNPTATVSVAGWNYATVTLLLGTAAASNVDATVALTEGDSTTYATHADLAVTTAAPNTSTGQIYRWFLDLRKRKKNLKISYAPNTNVARTAAAWIELSRGEAGPTTTAQQGVDVRVQA